MKDEATSMSTPALISEERIASQRAAHITRWTADEINNAIIDLWHAEQEYGKLIAVAGKIVDEYTIQPLGFLYEDAPDEVYAIQSLTSSMLKPNGEIYANRGSSDIYAVRKVQISIRKYYALNRRLRMAIDKYNERKAS